MVPGPASTSLGEEIAKLLSAKVVGVEHKTFPDGESYIRLTDSVRGEKVVVVQSTGPDQNKNLMELFLLVDTAYRLGADSVIAVVPYLAYSRQHKEYRPGEAISAITMAKLLKSLGADGFVTVNVHDESILGEFPNPVNVSAITQLASHFVEEGMAGAFALAPDDGAVDIAKEADSVLRGGYGWLEKTRDVITGEVSVEEKRLGIEGRVVIIFDDMISTGGTVVKAAQLALKQGAARVFAACVHPLLVGGALDKILDAGVEEVVGTNTVPSPVSRVSVAPVIAEALSKQV